MESLEKSLGERVELAKNDKLEMNKLIEEYMPFIKSEASKSTIYGVEYDDKVSIAMLVFMNCIYQYSEDKGKFLSFVSVSIRNRIIDESRKGKKHNDVIPLFPDEDSNEASRTIEEKVSIDSYNNERERMGLAEEIDMLRLELNNFDIDFMSLEEISPKQARSRIKCMRVASEIVKDDDMRENLFKNQRVSQAELARRMKISEKSIEKHRKYIVTLAVILTGDYIGIKAFLPSIKEVS